MTKDDLNRKQTTIFSADVAGFGRLMCHDELTTVITISAYRQLISELTERYRGRVVDAVGDNLLAEFGSPVDAIAAAVAVQKELRSRNAELTADKRMLFRIGINYGEVIAEGGRLYGTGVNIAARLESKADPGGICISRAVVDRVRDRLPLHYEYMCKCSVKNICEKVEIFRIAEGAESKKTVRCKRR